MDVDKSTELSEDTANVFSGLIDGLDIEDVATEDDVDTDTSTDADAEQSVDEETITLADVVASDEDTDSTEDVEQPSDSQNTMFKLPTGDEISLEELLNGYMRQSDYTKKRQEESEKVKSLQQQLDEAATLTQLLKDDPMAVVQLAAQDIGTDVDTLLEQSKDSSSVNRLVAEAVQKALKDAVGTELQDLKTMRDKFVEQETADKLLTQANNEFAKLEKEVGKPISEADRVTVLKTIADRNGRVEDIDLVFQTLNAKRERIIREKARAKAAAVGETSSSANVRLDEATAADITKLFSNVVT